MYSYTICTYIRSTQSDKKIQSVKNQFFNKNSYVFLCLHVHYMFNYVDKNAFCKILKLQVFSYISTVLRLFFSMYIFVPFHFIHPPPFAHCLLSHQINREMSRASPHGASSKQKYDPLVNTVPLNLVRQTLQFPLQNQSGQVEIDRLAHQLRADTYFSARTPRRTALSKPTIGLKRPADFRFSQRLVKTASDVENNKIGTIILSKVFYLNKDRDMYEFLCGLTFKKYSYHSVECIQ